MTYRAEVDGVAVPESATAGATSHKDAAQMVAHVNYAGQIITVEQALGGEIDRRWFEIVADAATGQNTVTEVRKTASGNVFRLGGRDD